MDAATKSIVSGARDLRNTVHPRAELCPKRPETEEAEALWAAARLVHKALSQDGGGQRVISL